MTDKFVHLHVHSEYSILDGAAKVSDMTQKAAEDEMPGLGITDHGNLYGAIPHYKACKKVGVNPIIGTELYQALDHRSERIKRKTKRLDDFGGEDEAGRKSYYHLTALAENNEGYKNLIQLSSRSFLEGYYQKPRVDWDLLSQHSKGIIVTSGCLGGQVLQYIMHKDYKQAKARAGILQDIFGRDNFFIEIQNHGIEEQLWTNPILLKLAKEINAPVIATNDSHYTNHEDHEGHDTLLCIQTGSYRSDPNRFKFHGDQHYLKSSQEMWDLFGNEANCCSNTLWINERCNVEIELDGKLKLPKFEVPENYNDDNEYLRALVYGGAKKRYENLSDEIVERIEFELNVIQSMNYASYFLMLWDIVRFARSMDIRTGPGRGSAAGAIIAYCLGITQIDPIKYDLLFERFLNPDRISPPDIDLDVDSRYRDVLINYAADKYGRDHVSQIITYSTIKARAALRDAARVLEFPYEVGDKLARAMPPLIAGRDTPLSACLELDPEYSEGYELAEPFREMYETDDEYRTVTDVALKLEGLRRQDGIHAAAVVISDAPITEYLPVQRKPDRDKSKALEELPIVTQYEMHAVEELGLLKMDFLGLRNLDVISDSLKLIKDIHGVDIDIDNIPLDDEKTYELLRKGETVGIFQLESPPMRSLIRSLAPTTVNDLSALVALYRPGPMAANMHNEYADRKNNRKSVELYHEDAQEILSETYQLMIFQEQMMKISQKFAGYTLAQADSLRKATGKKDRNLMKSERVKFIDSCVKNGYDESVGKMWFDIIEPFADYSFNKCLVGETQILTKTGASSINDIALNLERGEKVILLSLDEETVVEDECTEVIDSGELDVYEIEFDNGTKIEATLDHKFLCMDGVYYTLEDILKYDLEMIEIENSA